MEEVRFNFENLIVYQKSLDSIDLVYDTYDKFPKMEAYILPSQDIRAANSIALNISEGAGNNNTQFHRYIQIALDSTGECVVCSTIAKRRKYITKDQNRNVRIQLVELSKMIASLQKHVKKKIIS